MLSNASAAPKGKRVLPHRPPGGEADPLLQPQSSQKQKLGSPFVGRGRGASSSARQPTLTETDQPGVMLAWPPPPPPARNVTEYISAEEWDAESRCLRQLCATGAHSQSHSC